MVALRELFGTDIGLLSLGVLVFIVGRPIFFVFWFPRKMAEDARALATTAGRPAGAPPAR
jgi:hypothetical protein